MKKIIFILFFLFSLNILSAEDKNNNLEESNNQNNTSETSKKNVNHNSNDMLEQKKVITEPENLLTVIETLKTISAKNQNVTTNVNQDTNTKVNTNQDTNTNVVNQDNNITTNVNQDTTNSNVNNNDKEIEFTEKELILKNFISLIKKENQIEFDSEKLEKNINDLLIKMSANLSSGFSNAYLRDSIEVSNLNQTIIFYKTINQIINLRKNYSKKEDFIKVLNEANKTLEEKVKISEFEKKYKEVKEVKSIINNKIVENYLELEKNYLTYKMTFKYIETNVNSLVKNNVIIEKMNISYWLNIINKISMVEDINFYLNYYLKIDLARTILALIVFFIINSLRVFVIPILSKLIEKKINHHSEKNKNAKIKLYLFDSFNIPVRFFILFFSFETSIKIIHNGQFNLDNVFIIINTLYLITFTYLIYNLFNEWINHFSADFFDKYPNIRKEMVGFILKMLRVLLFTIVLLFVLTQLNFDIKAVIASLGVGGIAVALAAKDTLSNLFASVNIMLDDSFSQGDWIVTDKYEGTVIEIRMRTTTIRTFDNALVTIPNTDLAGSPIKNWNKRKIGRRIKMNIGVTYESNMNDLKNALEEIREMLKNHPDIATEKIDYDENRIKSSSLTKKEDQIGIKKTLLVFLDQFSSSSIDILICCFTRSVVGEEWLETKEDVLFKISDIIKNNNLEFAYPTQVTWVKNDPSLKLDNIKSENINLENTNSLNLNKN